MSNRSFFGRITSFLLDIRTLQVIGQVVFVVLVASVVLKISNDMLAELSSRNISPTFNFLDDRAGFQLSDAGDYTPDDTYQDAFVVGAINTLRVVILGLVLTTILGVLWGIFLLSSNWLVRNITVVIVEILRNTPLLVQLFVWYFIVLLAFPPVRDSIAIPSEGVTIIPVRWLLFMLAIPVVVFITRRFPETSISRMFTPILAVGIAILLEIADVLPMPLLRLELQPWIFLSSKGVAYPAIIPTERFGAWMLVVAIGVLLAVVVYQVFKRRSEAVGKSYPRGLYAFLVIVVAAVIGWVVVSAPAASESIPVVQDGQVVQVPRAEAGEQLEAAQLAVYDSTPLSMVLPRRQGLRFADGVTLLPEFAAVLLGLVIYTAAFIAEIVRAGILAVSHGQVEAARALGLTQVQSLRMIILPQALRIIIPPLGNQYLNLAKNSSLAIAVSFTDVFQVMGTVINQTNQSVSGILMLMGFYLVMSLVIAAVMNVINGRFQLVTRNQKTGGLRRLTRMLRPSSVAR